MSQPSGVQGQLTGAQGRDVAESRLRAEINRGEVVPGQRLVEAELSERYSVTRNSVRLALDVLCAEGLLERIPNKGARVRTVSTEDAVEIMECRMVLDGLLTRKAVEHADDDTLAALGANFEQMEQAVASLELLKYSELIQEHHALVQRAARHRTATELLQRLQGQIVRHQFRLSLRPERARQSLEELRLVVQAVLERDTDRAEEMARAHLCGVIAALRSEAGVA
jgi:DNA-binding GntR family transcriptional regulator